MDKITNAVAISFAGIEDRFDLCTIRKSHRSSGRIQRELMQKTASQLSRIACKNGLQFVDVLKAATVRQLTAGVHWFSKCVGEVVACAVDAGDAFSLFNASITCSPAA